MIAQDIFPTETTALADVVLPAAQWSEKTGTFTNVDRTVHLAHKAVEPPGEAWPDLKIFSEYAHRMGFKDKVRWFLLSFHHVHESHIPTSNRMVTRSSSGETNRKKSLITGKGRRRYGDASFNPASPMLTRFAQGRPVDYSGMSYHSGSCICA